jgi:hypothetical protein
MAEPDPEYAVVLDSRDITYMPLRQQLGCQAPKRIAQFFAIICTVKACQCFKDLELSSLPRPYHSQVPRLWSSRRR